MNVMAKIQDNKSVDARTRDAAGRQPNAPNSDEAQQFDGVLSEVTSDAKSDVAKALTPGDVLNGLVEVPPSASAIKAPADAQTLVAPSAVTMGALLELLGKGPAVPGQPATAPDTTAKATKDAKTKTATGTAPDGTVDDVLQKLAGKDTADTSDPPAPALPGASPTPASTDLVSLLMLGAAVTPAAAAVSAVASPPQEGTAGRKASATAIPGARDMPLEGTDHTDSKEVIVSDISVETHLAPAAPNNNASFADTHRKPSKQSPPDVEAKPVTTAPAATPDVSSQITGALSAPLRSIANAVVELASRIDSPVASAAAPAVEQSKPVLGVARTMTLQMNPANLGTVDIRLHMTGQTLDVQLTVSDPRTLGMVNRERDTLATALGDQNFALNSLVIQDGGAAASSGGNNAASQGDTGSNARSERQGGGFGSDGQAGGNRSPGQGTQRNLPDEQALANDAALRTGTPVRSGSLFV